MGHHLREIVPLDEGKYTYKTEPKGKEKTPKWVKRTLNIKTPITRDDWEKAKKANEELDEGDAVTALRAQAKNKSENLKNLYKSWDKSRTQDKVSLAKKRAAQKTYEETELDEAKRPVYKRRGSLRAQVKSKATIAREQAGRRKAARAAGREAKETGEKIKIRPFGNWAHKRAAAKRKLEEEGIQELSLAILGRFVDKAGAEDYARDSKEHRKGINLALRKRGEHKHTSDVPPRVRASIDGKRK